MWNKLTSTFVVLFVAQIVGAQTSGDSLRTFLTSCAYGTAGGAVVGLVSLAFNEDPKGNAMNIAKGASLGLYAGIGWGLYRVYGPGDRGSQEMSWIIAPTDSGAQFLFTKSFF